MSNGKKKKEFKLPSAYTVLLIITAIIAIVTQFVPGVEPAKFSDFIMSPVNGLSEAFDIATFILLIGGFLGVVTKTGALDAGIGAIVKKLKGKELTLIPILMIIFSLGGTSYGMAEETIAFYALVVTAMMAAGFDPLVGAATILLGAGCGVLGSTVNPFLVSVSIAALSDAGITVSQPAIIGLGVALWLSTLAISIFFVMSYAKKVKANASASLLSKEELDNAKEAFSKSNEEIVELTGRRKIVLALFGLSFVVMVISVIPWGEFGVKIFENTSFLTGAALGEWWFNELGIWFLLMSVVIGLVYGLKEKDIVSSIIAGAADMIGVALVIGVSRGISVMMSSTGLDMVVLNSASDILNGMSPIIFTNLYSFIILYSIYIRISWIIYADIWAFN